ncbi:MAG: hypothetical protein ETSY2_13290 [Candidatus Entotheonella gemina]|uniref:DUF5678 domain-containing protein n=1 Tax=Candidatus Entotheonella gemina TaxID=1429439 RepID=W4MA62_9BACT|nr:MAG: hypothetical protein ETSY2_13290 [Candidatus Entotheonella gemina]
MIPMDDLKFQEQYGGQYVACQDGHVIASAPTYDELSDHLDALGAEENDLIVEYVEPVATIRVY